MQNTLGRAKAFFRKGEYQQAREIIAQTPASKRSAALLYLDGCLARLLGEHVERRAPRYDPDDEASDDAVYYRAFSLWLDERYSDADNLLRAHNPHSDYARALFLLLRGFVFAAYEEYVKQINVTMRALRILLDAVECDLYLVASASQTLAVLAREMPSPASHSLLTGALSRLSRADITEPHTVMHIRRGLALVEGLHGDHHALTHLLVAGRLAQTNIEHAFVQFDYALAATWAGQHKAASAAFNVGYECVEGVGFRGRCDEGAFALTVGAVAGCTIDPTRARLLAERATEAVPTLSARWGFAHGRPARAFVNEALALTTDDPGVARKHGLAAADDFEHLGFFWRAGRLTVHLYKLTGHIGYRTRARRLLELYADGPLAFVEDAQESLPPRQRQIVRLLAEGRNIKEIAAEIGRAESSVRKMITRIHKRLKVHNRAELLAVLAREAS